MCSRAQRASGRWCRRDEDLSLRAVHARARRRGDRLAQLGHAAPPGAFGLKGATFDIVDQNFVPVSALDVHLHHIVFTTNVRQDRLCPDRSERFMGSGMERTPIPFRDPYAYLVGASDPWGSIYHVMDETAPGTPAKTVYIQYTLTYEPGANASNKQDGLEASMPVESEV